MKRKIILILACLILTGCAPQTEMQGQRQQQWIQQMQAFIQGMNQQQRQRQQDWDRRREINALEGIERNLRD